MHPDILTSLTAILVLGVTAQWLAWRLGLPSILLLLLFGIVAGPVTGYLLPDDVLGPLVMPLVSISVAIILFEGGLILKFSELRKAGAPAVGLITAGLFITWMIASIAAHRILGMAGDLALLQGAILVVSGPTVILPLLRHVRLSGRLGFVLKWEGILVDPIGVLLAVVVLEMILTKEFGQAHSLVAVGVFKALGAGIAVGLIGAVSLGVLIKRFWIPDFLQNPATLMSVILVFLCSNLISHESGLLAVVVMGVALTNQSYFNLRHIAEFKENLRVLLISGLFIVLAARLKMSDLTAIGAAELAFLGILIFVARPLAAFASTIGMGFNWRERLYLGFMAPRGIVAAALASVLSLGLLEAGHAGAERLVPVTFLVIIGTVAFYGLAAAPLARLLRVSEKNPQGLLVAGANRFARSIALILKKEGFSILLIDTNWSNVTTAKMAGLKAEFGDILSEELLKNLELDGIGRFAGLTANDNANSLAALRFSEVFGREEVYQLAMKDQDKARSSASSLKLRGRFLFNRELTYEDFAARLYGGMTVKATLLTKEFGLKDFQARNADQAIPLFVIDSKKHLSCFTADHPRKPSAGDTLISLVPAEAAA